MKRYWVNYEVMQGDVGLIVAKRTFVDVQSSDGLAAVERVINAIDSRAKIVEYSCEDDDYVPMIDDYYAY